MYWNEPGLNCSYYWTKLKAPSTELTKGSQCSKYIIWPGFHQALFATILHKNEKMKKNVIKQEYARKLAKKLQTKKLNNYLTLSLFGAPMKPQNL